ncbi:MAG TPA: prolipoprotein diacylglyceryl transferase [Candidatus Limnocylindria bacterium]|nr:prolipoprotein diacylglyceryl transferase [Candidatus Limnocylindria bacterium]
MIPLTIVIDLEPNLFRIGPFLITWHGVFAVLGILAGARLGLWLLSKDGVDVSRGADGVAWMVLVGLIGARLLYVWENFKLFSGNLTRIFLVTEGGISQWGGLFGAMVGAYIWARRSAFSYWKLLDAAGAAAMIGLAIGRIGDVINGEHHGTPTTLPWGVEYVNPDTLGQPGQVVHPEVAYEMILTLVLFGAILPFHQRLKTRLPDGVLGLTYLGLYGAGRFFLSYFRTDPAVFAGLRQAQLASLLMVAFALIAMPILFRRRGSTMPAAQEPTEPELDEAMPAAPDVVVSNLVESEPAVEEPPPVATEAAEPEAPIPEPPVEPAGPVPASPPPMPRRRARRLEPPASPSDPN